MEKDGVLRLRLCILGLYVCFAAIGLVHCDSTKPPRKILHFLSKLDTDASNTDPYVGSPFSMSPYDSLPPYPLPDNTPPYCINPPFTPLPPSTTNPPSTGGYTPTPPPASTVPNLPGPTPIPEGPPQSPPTIIPSPPAQPILSPPYYEPSPPSGSVPTPLTPPYYEPSPPSGSVPTPMTPPYNIPSPSGSLPSPKFLPPIVFPPPTVPPPPRRTPTTALWCVAKPSVPDPIIQEAMNYACGSGAGCDPILPSGSCFTPNTLFAHASYAFNSYFQRTKRTGGNCDFGGTAILVTVDPSYDGCHFIYF